MRRHRFLAAMAALVVLASACGTSSGGNAQAKVGGTLTIDNESGGLWSCAFNPFNGSVTGLSVGIFYEPLVYDNLLTDKKTNWLASGYEWSPDNKTLTFTIRSGVKWSDGQDFSADDVLYTFNLIKQHPELDLQSVWTVLSSVTKSGTDKVVMTFANSAVPYFFPIADQVSIVPQHIWSAIKDPVGDSIANPIGTGPFTLGQCTPQNITYTRNTTKAPLDDKAVRQAFAFGIDRNQASQKGESGYEPPGNQTGVPSPTFDSWIDQSAVSKYGYKFDVSKATSLLQSAGFTKNSSGVMQDSSGHKLSFNVITIAGYTDWDATLQVVADSLKQVGIEVKVQDLSANDYFDKLFSGKFDLAYGSLNTQPGPSPYYELRNTMDSATTAGIGQTASGDYGRYKNPAVDTLFDQFGATTDSNKQHDLIKQIEAVTLEDVPVVPVTEGVAWYEWSTKDFAGWPTQQDPYAAPAPWNLPDMEVVLIHLYKTS